VDTVFTRRGGVFGASGPMGHQPRLAHSAHSWFESPIVIPPQFTHLPSTTARAIWASVLWPAISSWLKQRSHESALGNPDSHLAS
jgi:hypothetical protein